METMDYYKILKVSPDATDVDIKDSYKKLAMLWHPDKNPANKIEAESQFKLICEAYGVLADPENRRIYDNRCKTALKSGVILSPPRKNSDYTYAFPSSSTASCSSSHQKRQSHIEYRYNPRSPVDIYTDIYNEIYGNGGIETGGHQMKKVKAPPVKRSLLCSLEELYKGVVKRVKITRTIIDHDRKSRTKQDIVMINILPGWKKGTTVTFSNMGNQEPDIIPADIIFVIEEKPHARYTRDGNDLIINARINKILEIPTLDGRPLMVPLPGIVTPGYVHIVPNEGMPLPKKRGKKGDLKIKITY